MEGNKFLEGIDIKPLQKSASAVVDQTIQKEASAAEVWTTLCKVANDGAQSAVVEWAKQNPELAPIALGKLMGHIASNQ
jgi:hypothetical protein